MFDTIRPFFTNPPKRSTSHLGASMSDQDEPAIPAFQQAWIHFDEDWLPRWQRGGKDGAWELP